MVWPGGFDSALGEPSMEIYHLLENFLPVRQAYISEYLNALKSLGCENRIFAYKRSNEDLFPAEPVFTLHKTNLLSRSLLAFQSRTSGHKSYLTTPCIQDIRRHGGRGILHAHFLWMAGTAAEVKRETGIPTCLSAYGEDQLFRAAASQEHSAQPIIEKELTSAVAEADRILLPSNYLVSLFSKVFGHDARVTLWRIGVDVSKYTAATHSHRDKLHILVVARLIKRKGIEYLVKALPLVVASVPDVNLTLIGDGPERQPLLELARSMGVSDHVSIMSSVPSLGDYYSASDVFVLPSIVESDGVTEGLGVTSLEAAASSLPVVASRVGGVPETVDDGVTGYLVEPQDVEGLASRVVGLLQDEEMRRRMGIRGRKKIEEQFNLEKQATQLRRIYDELGRE
jgi:glycosyltransferase involved in cell wall biosynthesis